MEPVAATIIFLSGMAFVGLIILVIDTVMNRQFDKRGLYSLDDPRRYDYGKRKDTPK